MSYGDKLKTIQHKDTGCTPCRLVGGTGVTILGVYIIVQGRFAPANTPLKGKIHSALTTLIGLTFVGLGVSRLGAFEIDFKK